MLELTFSLNDNPRCHKCGGHTTYIHDIKCPICDNKTIVFCPRCKYHISMSDAVV